MSCRTPRGSTARTSAWLSGGSCPYWADGYQLARCRRPLQCLGSGARADRRRADSCNPRPVRRAVGHPASRHAPLARLRRRTDAHHRSAKGSGGPRRFGCRRVPTSSARPYRASVSRGPRHLEGGSRPRVAAAMSALMEGWAAALRRARQRLRHRRARTTWASAFRMSCWGCPPDDGGCRTFPTESISRPSALGSDASLPKAAPSSSRSGLPGGAGTRPQTVAYGLNDSPRGSGGWIVERSDRAWSDCDGDVERRMSHDDMLNDITVYSVTQTANSAARIYYEAMHGGEYVPLTKRIEVPTGCALFPKETVRAPRAWADMQPGTSAAGPRWNIAATSPLSSSRKPSSTTFEPSFANCADHRPCLGRPCYDCDRLRLRPRRRLTSRSTSAGIYDRLREDFPCYHNETLGFYAVSRFRDVWDVIGGPRGTWSSRSRGVRRGGVGPAAIHLHDSAAPRPIARARVARLHPWPGCGSGLEKPDPRGRRPTRGCDGQEGPFPLQ